MGIMLEYVEKIRNAMQQSDTVDQAVRGTPAVGGALIAGLTLNAWVMVATFLYVVLQAVYLARKWWREEKDYKRKNRKL